jgi:hypothetical protein
MPTVGWGLQTTVDDRGKGSAATCCPAFRRLGGPPSSVFRVNPGFKRKASTDCDNEEGCELKKRLHRRFSDAGSAGLHQVSG